MNNTNYESLEQIRQDLKVLRLKKEINLEMLKSSRKDFEDMMQPLNLANRILGPVKKIFIAYLLKKVVR